MPLALAGESYFLSSINDCIQDMAGNFTTVAYIYSTNFLCTVKVAGLGEMCIQQKLLCMWYLNKIIGQRMTILLISRYVCDLDTSTVIKVYNHAYYIYY